MNIVLVVGVLVLFIYHLIQFARQEHIQEFYEDTIIDIEGRLEWAHTRTYFPLGMKSQLQVSNELLEKSKLFWENNRWDQAYQIALQSQEAMNRAQNIYSSAIRSRQRGDAKAVGS